MSGSWATSEAPARRDDRKVLAVDRSADDQPRPSGRDKPGDIAGEPKNRGEPSAPGLTNWLLATVAVLPTMVGLGSAAHVRQWWTPEWARFSNFLPTLTALRRGLPTVLTNATSPGRDRQKTPA